MIDDMARPDDPRATYVRLGADLKTELAVVAQSEDLSMAQVIRKALRAYFDGGAR